MSLTKTPVKNPLELQKILDWLPNTPSSYKIAVEALIFSTDGKLLLHKRGKGCRDEIGKLEGIGGRFEESDGNFLNALQREIKEEIGEDAQIEMKSFFEVRKDTVRDVKDNKEQHWIIVSYLCTYTGGELKITEPDKNEGYFFVDIHTVEEKTLSSSAFSALQSLKKHQFAEYDPSKYAIYQMVDCVLQNSGKRLVNRSFPNMFLRKITPFQGQQYSYAYVFEKNLSEADFTSLQDFFQTDVHRINIPADEELATYLQSKGYTKKYTDKMMERTLQNEDFSVELPPHLTLRPVNDQQTLQDHRQVIAEAYVRTPETIQTKFWLWIYDEILLNPADLRMNAFVLYDDGIPASTGMYYAFDTFSVENIGTKPSFGRKGYAQIIIKHLLQEAKKLEYAKAYLVDSKGSQAYINLGFKTLQETMTFVSPH